MKLAVVVPTYRRSHLLRKALQSITRASVPHGLDVEVLVVDNNSKDDTAETVASMQPDFQRCRLRYVLETKAGSSNARNAGIQAAADADLVGFFDDDEEIGPEWLQVVAREFADPNVQFIGGPCLANWVTPQPDWLPPGYHSVIGAVPPKPRAPYDDRFPGILMGGNAVVRKQVFDQVGLYDTTLGRSGKGLLSEEDADFYRRLRTAGIQGTYVPELVIYHYIAPERLTRTYHRRWAYWRAVSQGIADRVRPEPVTYLFGVPRHRFGRAARSLFALPAHRLGPAGKGRAFADELATWDLVGFIYGKHFAKVNELYATE